MRSRRGGLFQHSRDSQSVQGGLLDEKIFTIIQHHSQKESVESPHQYYF